MTASPYVDQSADGLRFTLLAEEIDPAQFNVLESGHLECPGFRVDAAIIGASHYFVFKSVASVLTEVFACMEVNAGPVKAFCGPLSEVAGRMHLSFPDVEYVFEPRRMSWREGEKELLRIEAHIRSARPGTIGLIHEFPKAPGDPRIPKTAVWMHAEGDQLIAETLHSYPNEEAIVYTKTVIEPKQG